MDFGGKETVVTAAFLAGLAAIVGIAVGRFWDTRSESARWRRDQKTASYQRLAEQFQAVYEAIRVLAVADSDDGTFAALVDHTRTSCFASWDSAVAAVWLHGSKGVVISATALDDEIGGLFYAAIERRISTVAEWNTARRPARSAFEQFIDAARNELGLPPVPVRIFTDPLPHIGDAAGTP